MNVILVFSKIENGKHLKRILQQSGFEVNAVCTTGAKALQAANSLSGGIVVCGYRFSDMMYSQLYEYLPPQFEMLLVASAGVCNSREYQDIICLNMPLRIHELIETMHMMSGTAVHRKTSHTKKGGRTEEEKALLLEAKALLMERNQMTEEQAHRYLQKRSMDNGTGLVETAQMVLSLMKA